MPTLARRQAGDPITAGPSRDDCAQAFAEIATYIAGTTPADRPRDHELLRATYDEILDTYSLLRCRLEILGLPTANGRRR